MFVTFNFNMAILKIKTEMQNLLFHFHVLIPRDFTIISMSFSHEREREGILVIQEIIIRFTLLGNVI